MMNMYIHHEFKINFSLFTISKIHSAVSILVSLFIIQVSAFSDPESLVLHLQNLDSNLYKKYEKEVRDSLDKLIERYGIYGIYPRKQNEWSQNSVKVDLEEGHYPKAGARFLRAYETFNDLDYLNAGLKTADLARKWQFSDCCLSRKRWQSNTNCWEKA